MIQVKEMSHEEKITTFQLIDKAELIEMLIAANDVINQRHHNYIQEDAYSNRFSINKTILSDFALFAIIDNEQNKVVCHLVYDNGEQYCDEMANKMVVGLNGL